MRPKLARKEIIALEEVVAAIDQRRGNGFEQSRRTIARLVEPVVFTLDWIGTIAATRFAAARIVIIETNRYRSPCWAWSQQQCLEIACTDIMSFRGRHGEHASKARQQILALLCMLSGFNRLTEIGRFHRFHLAIKVFGRQTVESATERIYGEMAKIGYTGLNRYGVAQVLHTAFLMERQARIDAISIETLRRIADAGPQLLRSGAALLSRTLVRMGTIESEINNYALARAARRSDPTEYRATDGVPVLWQSWCERWRSASISGETTREGTYFGMLKFARWLLATHPGVTEPAMITRDIAIDYVAAVERMRVGEWSKPVGNAARMMGKPLTATSKVAHLNRLRRFLRDLQDWEWIPKRLDPERVLAVPRAIAGLLGPAPRIVADDVLAKIVWAGLNLGSADMLSRPTISGRRARALFYPMELARAITNLWLFAGLRSNEIVRLTVGCVRWQGDRADPSSMVCLLEVPVGKTATSFVKPVDAVVGQAIEAWEKVRHTHPKMLDMKTGRMVEFLFVHRGHRVAKDYINQTLIPLICAKAGVPQADARGPITSHRARATIATQLYNAKEPLTLFELKDWLGHADLRSTQHYAALTPTKLASAFRRAGYFERNLRTISVLVDGDAVRSGASARGEPWRFFDLGHGFCSYDFFEQCPHRMACAKCSFYIPKASAEAQALEARENLARMLQEIPLRDEERAAVEDGLEAMAKLVEGLRSTATPDGRSPAEIAAQRAKENH
jgi:integrase